MSKGGSTLFHFPRLRGMVRSRGFIRLFGGDGG